MNLEDYNKYYIQGSDHYLIPKYVFEELFDEMSNWKEEAKELKKQLEEYKRLGFKHLNDKCNKLENQQKEFIKYLEDKNKKINIKANGMGASSERDELITNARAYRKILQKYKEIIGVSNEY